MKEPMPTLTNSDINLNPVVRLNRIETEPRSDYWNLMKKVAEYDLKLKRLQHQHEQERMEMEREIHRKTIILLDRKIDALTGEDFYD